MGMKLGLKSLHDFHSTHSANPNHWPWTCCKVDLQLRYSKRGYWYQVQMWLVCHSTLGTLLYIPSIVGFISSIISKFSIPPFILAKAFAYMYMSIHAWFTYNTKNNTPPVINIKLQSHLYDQITVCVRVSPSLHLGFQSPRRLQKLFCSFLFPSPLYQQIKN